MMKRFFLVFCALVALAACESETEYKDIRLPAYRADIFYGTPIASADELARIGSGLKNYPLDGEYYLAADIDLSGYEPWRPIGADAIAPFTGTLNGNGRTIRGLKPGGGAAVYTGLFGYLQNARVTNVTVEFDNELSETVTMTATVNQYFGIVAGYSANSNISGVTVTTTKDKGLNLKRTTGNTNLYVGGLVGQTVTSSISGASVTLNLEIETSGITLYAGLVAGHSNGIINSCSVDGSVDIPASGGTVYVGGVAGQNAGTGLEDCLSAVSKINADIAGTSTVYAGGIVGYGPAASCGIKADYPVTIHVTGSADYIYVGGISGYLGNNSSITRCFVDAPVSIRAESLNAALYVGGITGQTGTGTTISNSFIRQGEVLAKMTGAAATGNKFVLAGGIAGYANGGSDLSASTISTCFSGADVTVESDWIPLLSSSAMTAAGGIAGRLQAGTAIENSGASGTVRVVTTSAGANGKALAGGLVGLGVYDARNGNYPAFTIKQSAALNPSVTVEHGANTTPYAYRIMGGAALSNSSYTLAADASHERVNLLDNYADRDMAVQTSGDSGGNWTDVAQTPNGTMSFMGSGNMRRTQEFFETSSLGWNFSTDWEWDTALNLPFPRLR